MAIGLNTDQLINAFVNNLDFRMKETTGALQAMAAGENPTTAEIVKKILTKFPNFPIEQATIVGIIFISLLDTIASNNNALAKAIPHLEF